MFSGFFQRQKKNQNQNQNFPSKATILQNQASKNWFKLRKTELNTSGFRESEVIGRITKNPRINTENRQNLPRRNPRFVQSLVVQNSQIVPEPNDRHAIAAPLRRWRRRVPLKRLISNSVHLIGIGPGLRHHITNRPGARSRRGIGAGDRSHCRESSGGDRNWEGFLQGEKRERGEWIGEEEEESGHLLVWNLDFVEREKREGSVLRCWEHDTWWRGFGGGTWHSVSQWRELLRFVRI